MKRGRNLKLNLKSPLGIVAGVFATLLLLVALPVIAQSNKKELSMNTDVQPPSTPQQMWERILMLIKTNNGFVTKQQVEKVMGIIFTSSQDAVDEGGVLGAAHIYSYEDATVQIKPLKIQMIESIRSINASFSWKNDTALSSSCLSSEKINQSLEELEFVEERRTIGGHSSAIYTTFIKKRDSQESKKIIANAENDEARIKNLIEHEKKIPLLIITTPQFSNNHCLSEFTMKIPAPL